jgi:hypothetical protein
MLNSAAQHIEQHLAGQPEEDQRQLASSLSQHIEQAIEQQRRDQADQLAQRVRSALSWIENQQRERLMLISLGLYQPQEREGMGDPIADSTIADRKSLSEQPFDTAQKLDKFLNLAFRDNYRDLTEKEQYILNVVSQSRDATKEEEQKKSGLSEDIFLRSRSAAMIGDIMRGQAVRATSGDTSVSDTVVTEVERRSNKYKEVKKTFWTTFQEKNRANTYIRDNIEQIIQGLNTDDGKTRRDALGKWTKMHIEGELDKYQTDKTRNMSDKFIKQLEILAKLQKVGLLEQEAVIEKKRKMLIKGKIEPILEEVNRCIEWAKSIDPSIENGSLSNRMKMAVRSWYQNFLS